MHKKLIALSIAALTSSPLYAGDWEHTVLLEGRVFAEDPLYVGQEENSASVAFETEYYTELGSRDLTFTFKPFFR